MAAKLTTDVKALEAELAAAGGKADAHEIFQVSWADPELAGAKAALDRVKGLVAGDAISVEAIKSADDAREALLAARDALAIQASPARGPPFRAAFHTRSAFAGPARRVTGRAAPRTPPRRHGPA